MFVCSDKENYGTLHLRKFVTFVILLNFETMQNPYFDMTVPVYIKMLTNLDALLDKGLAYAEAHDMTEAELLDRRLAPDMFPFVRQIQITTDHAKGSVARLCGIEAPVMEDNERTVAELHERIAKTIAFLKTITPEQFAGASEREIRIKYFPGEHFLGYTYLTQNALPNFFFHMTIAYALLRALGVEIGKADFNGMPTLIPDQA